MSWSALVQSVETQGRGTWIISAGSEPPPQQVKPVPLWWADSARLEVGPFPVCSRCGRRIEDLGRHQEQQQRQRRAGTCSTWICPSPDLPLHDPGKSRFLPLVGM